MPIRGVKYAPEAQESNLIQLFSLLDSISELGGVPIDDHGQFSVSQSGCWWFVLLMLNSI